MPCEEGAGATDARSTCAGAAPISDDRLDLLRDAIFGDLEVGNGKVGDEAPVLAEHAHVDLDDLRPRPERLRRLQAPQAAADQGE